MRVPAGGVTYTQRQYAHKEFVVRRMETESESSENYLLAHIQHGWLSCAAK